MYPEFIAIYVMLAVVIVLLGVVLFMLIKLAKGQSPKNNYMAAPQYNDQYYGQQYQQNPYQQNQYQYQGAAGGVVFCKQCATQYDASQSYCPQCGARR